MSRQRMTHGLFCPDSRPLAAFLPQLRSSRRAQSPAHPGIYPPFRQRVLQEDMVFSSLATSWPDDLFTRSKVMKMLMLSTVLALGAAPLMAQAVPPTTDTMTPGATATETTPTTAPTPQSTPSAGGWTNDAATATQAEKDAKMAEKKADKKRQTADRATGAAQR
jgi:hypothetical protein